MSPPHSGLGSPDMARALLNNANGADWIVQKFGGTSVGKFPDKIAEDIVRYELLAKRKEEKSSAS